MDGDGPGRFYRHLNKYTFHRFGNLFVFLVKRIFYLFPFQRNHFNGFVITIAMHINGIFINTDDSSDFAIVESFFRFGVVFYKHYLGTFFKMQNRFGREDVFGKISFDYCLEFSFFSGQFCHFIIVNGFGFGVMGG